LWLESLPAGTRVQTSDRRTVVVNQKNKNVKVIEIDGKFQTYKFGESLRESSVIEQLSRSKVTPEISGFNDAQARMTPQQRQQPAGEILDAVTNRGVQRGDTRGGSNDGFRIAEVVLHPGDPALRPFSGGAVLQFTSPNGVRTRLIVTDGRRAQGGQGARLHEIGEARIARLLEPVQADVARRNDLLRQREQATTPAEQNRLDGDIAAVTARIEARLGERLASDTVAQLRENNFDPHAVVVAKGYGEGGRPAPSGSFSAMDAAARRIQAEKQGRPQGETVVENSGVIRGPGNTFVENDGSKLIIRNKNGEIIAEGQSYIDPMVIEIINQGRRSWDITAANNNAAARDGN
jgi:hypothetical protein